MSLTKEARVLRDTLNFLHERLGYAVGGLRLPRKIRLNGKVTFDVDDGHLYVWNGRKVNEYTIQKFFMHHNPGSKGLKKMKDEVYDFTLFIKLRDKTLTARELIRCRNAEIRRHLLNEFGYDRLVDELGGKKIDRDGEHELIMITMRRDDEPVVLVRVKDSSTGAFYLLRVPPDVKTCKEAVAWTFDMPEEEYEPLAET